MAIAGLKRSLAGKFFLVLILSGCASSKLRTYQTFDKADKSITLPIGSEEPLGTIKDAFVRNHYRVVTYTKGSETTQTNGKDLSGVADRRTRYKLYVNISPANPTSVFCWKASGKIDYEISLVDLERSGEVVVMSGHGCENDVGESFLNALELNTK